MVEWWMVDLSSTSPLRLYPTHCQASTPPTARPLTHPLPSSLTMYEYCCTLSQKHQPIASINSGFPSELPLSGLVGSLWTKNMASVFLGRYWRSVLTKCTSLKYEEHVLKHSNLDRPAKNIVNLFILKIDDVICCILKNISYNFQFKKLFFGPEWSKSFFYISSIKRALLYFC